MKILPLPISLSAQISPPCNSVNSLLNISPSPVPFSPIFFLLTLGISPVVETTDGFVTIQLIDNSSEKIIKEYRYEVTHKYVTSWLSIVASLILWGDQWDLAMFHNHGFPQEMIVSKFQKDFYTDLSNQKILFVSNSKNEKRYPKERYAILPVIYSHSKDKKTSDRLYDRTGQRSVLVQTRLLEVNILQYFLQIIISKLFYRPYHTQIYIIY